MSRRTPPRRPSQASSTSSLNEQTTPGALPRENTIHLTPQSFANHPYGNHAGLDDPRSSSTQSLRPIESPGPYRRTLLIVYIHGFMGNESSFRSFPAHVHSLLTMTLGETHVVYTKIYPRYQSRKNISFARDAFSNWMSPHESDTTDVVLVGHSLGGILGAEVVLIPSHIPGSQDALQHRILGLIAFDTPFLGMHPGVVSTGIASLFRGSPDQSEKASESSTPDASSSWQSVDTTANDPHFNPVYANDVNLPVRSNKWERAWYFWNKHYGELRHAAQSYVKSHLEFGGCLADYPGLRRRYDAIRALEDVDDLGRRTNQEGRRVHRVRFVNYYTASTGRIKEKKPAAQDSFLTTEAEMQSLKPSSTKPLSPRLSRSMTPHLSLEEHQNEGVVQKTNELEIDEDSDIDEALETLEPQPHTEQSTNPAQPNPSLDSSPHANLPDGLPDIPAEPVAPDAVNKSQFDDTEVLKAAQQEYSRQIKAYEKSKKERQNVIREREKIIAKHEKQVKKEQEKAAKLAKKEQERQEKDKIKRQSTLNPEDQDKQMREEAKTHSTNLEAKKKDRKFCTLPAKDPQGQRDATWIRVYMEGMDEVVAHTSLFFVSDAYAKLVGDVAERIERWLAEDASIRILLLEPDQ